MAINAERLPLSQVLDYAGEIEDLMRGTNSRIQLAGSARRRKKDCGDVEFVLIPKTEPAGEDLFGEPLDLKCLHFERVQELLAKGVFEYRLNVNGSPSCGAKLQWLKYRGFPLDFYVASPETWACYLLIRTGDMEFSKKFARSTHEGGFLLTGQKLSGWQIVDRGIPLVTLEEEDVFRVTETPWVKPEDRHD